MKFELDNPGGSHKVRAARHIVRTAVQEGLITPGETTVIEKTGGNFGIGLALACSEIGVAVELAVGLSFSPVKRRYLEWIGCTLVGVEQLREGATPRQVLEWRLAHAEALERSYYYPDQFNNPRCVQAHEYETGRELIFQLRALPQLQSVRLVACAGTGAHLTGIATALRLAGYPLDVTLVEPDGCNSREGIFIDHPLEGMAVGVRPPLLDDALVNRVMHVTTAEAATARQWLARARGYSVGWTSGACLAVGRKLATEVDAGGCVVVIAYDHGVWYPC